MNLATGRIGMRPGQRHHHGIRLNRDQEVGMEMIYRRFLRPARMDQKTQSNGINDEPPKLCAKNPASTAS